MRFTDPLLLHSVRSTSTIGLKHLRLGTSTHDKVTRLKVIAAPNLRDRGTAPSCIALFLCLEFSTPIVLTRYRLLTLVLLEIILFALHFIIYQGSSRAPGLRLCELSLRGRYLGFVFILFFFLFFFFSFCVLAIPQLWRSKDGSHLFIYAVDVRQELIVMLGVFSGG